MSTAAEYSPVSLQRNGPESKRSLSRMLSVAPFFRYILDPLLPYLPSGLVAGIATACIMWRRFVSHRCGKDVTVGHLLLCLPLVWWFYEASALAWLRPTSHHALSHSGKLASYAMTAAFLTASKSNALVSLVLGLSFERLVNFHLASALLTLWMSLMHGIQIAYYNRGGEESHHHHDGDEEDHDHDEDHDEDDEDHDDHDGHRMLHHDSIHTYLGSDPNLWKFFVDGKRNTSGFSVLVALLLLVFTSTFHRTLRKWWFEGWVLSHVSGAIVVLVAGIIHGADVFIFAILWWGLDLVIRYGFMVGVKNPNTAIVTRVAEDVVQLELETNVNFQYEAGQFVQVSIPAISSWEFHPFSIASAPGDPQLTLYVKALPSAKTWTRKLYDFVGDETQSKSIRAFTEGPYGSIPSIIERPDKYSMAVFVCGGIGVTPCRSVLKYLLANRLQTHLQKIRFIWSVRDEGMLRAIPPLSLESIDESDVSQRNNDDNGIELVDRGQKDVTMEKSMGDDVDNSESGGCDEGAVLARRPLTLENEVYLSQTFWDNDDEANEKEVGDENKSAGKEAINSYRIHRGQRPDVDAVMKEVQAEALKEGWPNIFVMGCGPIPLLEELQAACKTYHTKEIQIDYHQEIFDY